MVVVAVIGALTAVAIPAYQNYVIRAEAMAGLATVTSLQTSAEVAFQVDGAMPTALDALGARDDMNRLGTLALVAATAAEGDTEASNGGIRFTFDGGSSIDGLIITALMDNPGWECTLSGTVPAGLELDGCTAIEE